LLNFFRFYNLTLSEFQTLKGFFISISSSPLFESPAFEGFGEALEDVGRRF
jgi:hypothetical protein